MNTYRIEGILIFLLMFMAGCGTINKAVEWVGEDELKQTLAGAGLRQGAMRYIEAGDKAERKAKVLAFADRIEPVLDNTTSMTIGELTILINKNIDKNSLKPSDLDLINSVVDLGLAGLDVKGGELTAENVVTAKELLFQLRRAASFY